MTIATVLKPFPYSDGASVHKLNIGQELDFPSRQYKSLIAGGYIGAKADANATDEESEKPRGRKAKAGRFRVGKNAELVPELGE